MKVNRKKQNFVKPGISESLKDKKPQEEIRKKKKKQIVKK
jgi:hypothetical protein